MGKFPQSESGANAVHVQSSSSSKIWKKPSIHVERQEDVSTGHISYTLNSKLLIRGAALAFWSFFICGEETTSKRGERIQVAELKKTSCLYLKGEIRMSELTTGIEYEVVFVVKLKYGGYGWEHPFTLMLSVPGQGDKRRLVNLYEKPKGEWIELKLGYFKAAGTGEVSFCLLQDGVHEKKGLVLKSAVVRPKSWVRESSIVAGMIDK